MTKERCPRILVVDDNADAADSLALLLELWGHEPEVCYDGPAALEAASTYRPRVVLLDLGMRGMDGFEVARRLRARPELAATVLIASTGYGDEAHRSRACAAGFDHYRVKPVDLDDLEKLLESVTPARRTSVLPEGLRQPQGATS